MPLAGEPGEKVLGERSESRNLTPIPSSPAKKQVKSDLKILQNWVH